jgi:hypothetical protein
MAKNKEITTFLSKILLNVLNKKTNDNCKNINLIENIKNEHYVKKFENVVDIFIDDFLNNMVIIHEPNPTDESMPISTVESLTNSWVESIPISTAEPLTNSWVETMPISTVESLTNSWVDLTTNITNNNNDNNINDINVNNANNICITNNISNVDVFLNSKCNNAINFTDLTGEIKVNLEDLQSIQKNQYTNTICGMINTQMEKYDVHTRPVHCYFNKETKNNEYHIRDENKWKKGKNKINTVLSYGIQKLDKNLLEKTKEHEKKFPAEMKKTKDRILSNGASSGKSFKPTVIINSITKNANITDMVV